MFTLGRNDEEGSTLEWVIADEDQDHYLACCCVIQGGGFHLINDHFYVREELAYGPYRYVDKYYFNHGEENCVVPFSGDYAPPTYVTSVAVRDLLCEEIETKTAYAPLLKLWISQIGENGPTWTSPGDKFWDIPPIARPESRYLGLKLPNAFTDKGYTFTPNDGTRYLSGYLSLGTSFDFNGKTYNSMAYTIRVGDFDRIEFCPAIIVRKNCVSVREVEV